MPTLTHKHADDDRSTDFYFEIEFDVTPGEREGSPFHRTEPAVGPEVDFRVVRCTSITSYYATNHKRWPKHEQGKPNVYERVPSAEESEMIVREFVNTDYGYRGSDEIEQACIEEWERIHQPV